MIFLIPFFSLSIFVKYNSTSIDCTEISPCNYTFALSHIRGHEQIYVCDSKIQDEKQLIDFHFFIGNISNFYLSEIKIFGNNTFINGTLFPSLFPSFLPIINSQIHFSNFTFYDFHNSIIYFRNSHNSSLTNILFDSNYLTEQISMFSSVFSTLTISNVTFQNSYQYQSSFLFTSSSQLCFVNCMFYNISMPTTKDLFFFMLINSQIQLHETNLSKLNFIGSGIFLITSKSNLTMTRVSLQKNVFDEMILVTHESALYLNSCKFNENYGKILSSHKSSDISIINSIFDENSSPGNKLFQFKKSKVIINYDCQFIKNVAEILFLFKGKNCIVNISYSDFISNYISSSLISSTSQSNLTMIKNTFKSNNVNQNLILLSNQAKGFISDIEFREIRSTAIKVNQFSSLCCSNLFFFGFPFIANSLIVVKKSSSLTVNSSQFNIQSINNNKLINAKISSEMNLVECVFYGSLDETVSDGYECVNCTFRRPNNVKHKFSFSISYFKAFYVLMTSFAVFEIGKLIFACFYYMNES